MLEAAGPAARLLSSILPKGAAGRKGPRQQSLWEDPEEEGCWAGRRGGGEGRGAHSPGGKQDHNVTLGEFLPPWGRGPLM